MAPPLSAQPWVRPHRAPLPRVAALEPGLSASVAEGDEVKLLRDQAPGAWTDGVVQEVLEKAERFDDGRVLPAGSLIIGGPPDEPVIVPPQDAPHVVRKALRVVLVAPGGGVDGNGSVYLDLDREEAFQVEVVGRKSTLYDRYPESWQSGGSGPPPNLASFGEDVLRMGAHHRADCLIFGSRGGQVVLPTMWRSLGDTVPPSVVLNGGCAMNLPGPPSPWPRDAVTVMLMAGQDFFRGAQTSDEYVQGTIQCVSRESRTTAILYVPEMKHMPQPEILGAALPHLVRLAVAWHAAPQETPMGLLQDAGASVERLGYGARLLFTAGRGQWQQMHFGPQQPDRPAAPLSPRAPRPDHPPPTRHLGTAPSVLPIRAVVELTPARHRALAAQAEREAEEAGRAGDHEARQRLLDLADGQEGEAYAAETDLANEEARVRWKAAKSAAAPPQQPWSQSQQQPRPQPQQPQQWQQRQLLTPSRQPAVTATPGLQNPGAQRSLLAPQLGAGAPLSAQPPYHAAPPRYVMPAPGALGTYSARPAAPRAGVAGGVAYGGRY